MLEIEVGDNGRGIHPNDLPYIFDRFYQSRQNSIKMEGGTGIDLLKFVNPAILIGEVYKNQLADESYQL